MVLLLFSNSLQVLFRRGASYYSYPKKNKTDGIVSCFLSAVPITLILTKLVNRIYPRYEARGATEQYEFTAVEFVVEEEMSTVPSQRVEFISTVGFDFKYTKSIAIIGRLLNAHSGWTDFILCSN